MKYEIFVIRLLVAILNRLVFPHSLDILRDIENQVLMSDASAWASSQAIGALRPLSKGDVKK